MRKPAASQITLRNGRISHKQLPEINHRQYKQIYDVFRVEKGKPVFLNDHLDRLFGAIEKSGLDINFTYQEIEDKLLQLIKESKVENGNIKIEVIFKEGYLEVLDYRASFIPTNYPDINMYENGVDCCLFERERKNPEIKFTNPELRKESDDLIAKRGVYETIFHSKEIITEGSRSNIFFISRNELWTAPDNLVLPGTIRKKVIEIAKSISIPLYQYPIKINELEKMDGAFITGTSPRVLPIRSIDDVNFKIPHPLINLIIREVQRRIDD